MIDLACPRLASIACGTLLSAAAAMPASAQILIDSDATGRIVAMSNLSTARGCAKASGRGRVMQRHYENGQIKGVTFKDTRYGESYLNLPLLGTIVPASARARVAQGFATLLVEGQELKVETLGCGAGGRIEKLAAMALVAPRPARVPTATAAQTAVQPAAPPSTPAAGDTGVKMDDGDETTAAPPAMPPRSQTETPRPLPTPVAPAPSTRPAKAVANDDEEPRWDLSSYSRNLKLGIADGHHFTTLMFDCVRGSGRMKVVVDDPKGKYRRGSRQSFMITAGSETVSASGLSSFNEMDDGMQIDAEVSVAKFEPLLAEIARQGRFVIKTPGGSQPDDIRGAAQVIPRFLSACRSRG